MRSMCWMFVLMAIFTLPHGLVQEALAIAPPSGTRELAVEDAGVVGFKKDFFGSLTVTPHAADPTGITEGTGHSRVTVTSGDGTFESDWVSRQVEFVAFRIHKNPQTHSPESYFPAVIGSRYGKVVRVIDKRNLIVAFEYNGGNADAPVVAEQVSGYFFIDCAEALRAMVASQTQPTVYRFKAGETYVTKGMPNIEYKAVADAGDMWWLSTREDVRANLKISAEDACRSGRGKVALPDRAYIKLTTHDRSFYMDHINVLGPTYTIPSIQEQWSNYFFTYGQGQCERTLEIRNCNTLAEKQASASQAHLMPDGASWLAPMLTSIIAGGGKHGDRGDGVEDITGYQRWHLLRSTWVALSIASVKNGDGAGNWLVIDGEEVDEQGQPVNMVYEAVFMKRTRFDDVMLSFHDGEGDDNARRTVRAESNDFAWPMVQNQYWNGGVSNGSTETNTMEVDGFTLYFGNNGDWRRELNNYSTSHCLINASQARLFDRIPRVGDKLSIEHAKDATWHVWGWGLQEKDVLTINGKDYTIASRKRSVTKGPLLGITPKGVAWAHFWEITFTEGADLLGEKLEATVKLSQTEGLLDGKPRKTAIKYSRDYFGHWQYNRDELNYQFRNILFNGMHRQTAGPGSNRREYGGLWELPVTKEWINCVAMQTNGSEKGVPAKAMPSEAFSGYSMAIRNAHPDSKTRDHHIQVDGGRLFTQRSTIKASPVKFKNRPTLIYGGPSFGGPRLYNPIMLDKKGLDLDGKSQGLILMLTDGFEVDLSHSTFGKQDELSHNMLSALGHGTLILNNVQFNKYNDKEYNGLVVNTRTKNPDLNINLTIMGDGGQGALKFLGTPVDAKVHITHWSLGEPVRSKPQVQFSPEWLAMPGFSEKVSINGKAGDDINR